MIFVFAGGKAGFGVTAGVGFGDGRGVAAAVGVETGVAAGAVGNGVPISPVCII